MTEMKKFLSFAATGFIAAVLLLNPNVTRAEVIEFPEEELATESVLPKFDQPTATKKRVVPTKGRTELDFHTGTSLADAFFNIVPVGGTVNYHLTEVSALELRADYYINSVTSYKEALINDLGPTTIGATAKSRLDKNPASKYSVMIGYEFTPYYGKISMTKSRVMNLSIVASVDAGMIAFEDGSSPVVSLNIGEKLYFSPNWGIKADLRTMLYNQTDVIYDPPEKRMMTNVLLTVGVLYLMPSM